MPAPQSVAQAVRAAIVGSAHLAAFEHVAAAAQVVQRLGRLSTGRWRSAARDLSSLVEDLQTGLTTAAEAVASSADEIGVPEDTLWSVGDAAGTLDLLRDAALEEAEEGSPAARLLQGEVVFGASFVEDENLPDRGTTLVFGWPEPLSPAAWPWQANWVSDGQADGDGEAAEELDLFESGEIEGEDSMLAALADELGGSSDDAREALRGAAMALTRASLLAGAGDAEDEDPPEEPNGEV